MGNFIIYYPYNRKVPTRVGMTSFPKTGDLKDSSGPDGKRGASQKVIDSITN